MKQWKVSDSDGGPAMRCGRCADILPDETLTFCKTCGVPFSEVYPTNSFALIADHKRQAIKQQKKIRLIAFSLALLGGLVSFYFIHLVGSHSFYTENSRPGMREIHFYIKDFETIPSLHSQLKREAIFVSQQAFEDHFGLGLDNISIHDNAWPTELNGVYEETQNQLDESYAQQSLIQLNVPAMHLSFWETKVFPAVNLQRIKNPEGALNVVITNLPIFAGSDKDSSVETRHLSHSGLITGLGHPALVVISTFRLYNQDPRFKKEIPAAQSLEEKTRFLGEYGIAHELGHALLGLSDYVTPPEFYGIAKLRRPAEDPMSSSIRQERKLASYPADTHDVTQCLMHTDAGGGTRAWESLKKKKLGVHSNCSAYENLTRAFRLRFQAIRLLKIGQREEAQQLHAEAIRLARPLAQDWLTAEWNKEHQMFMSYFSRLTFGLFMIESNND